MSQRIVINPQLFARDAASQHGDLNLVELTRVLDMLTVTDGVVRYELHGKMSSSKRPQLLLGLEGSLFVRCERCLEGVEYPLDIQRLLEFVSDEELTQDEIEDDSKDFLPVESELDVVALIEDEIILDLPTAPRHESCVLPDSGQSTESLSPFSVLKGFLNKA